MRRLLTVLFLLVGTAFLYGCNNTNQFEGWWHTSDTGTEEIKDKYVQLAFESDGVMWWKVIYVKADGNINRLISRIDSYKKNKNSITLVDAVHGDEYIFSAQKMTMVEDGPRGTITYTQLGHDKNNNLGMYEDPHTPISLAGKKLVSGLISEKGEPVLKVNLKNWVIEPLDILWPIVGEGQFKLFTYFETIASGKQLPHSNAHITFYGGLQNKEFLANCKITPDPQGETKSELGVFTYTEESKKEGYLKIIGSFSIRP